MQNDAENNTLQPPKFIIDYKTNEVRIPMYEYSEFLERLVKLVERYDALLASQHQDQNSKTNSGHPRTSDNKQTQKGDK